MVEGSPWNMDGRPTMVGGSPWNMDGDSQDFQVPKVQEPLPSIPSIYSSDPQLPNTPAPWNPRIHSMAEVTEAGGAMEWSGGRM